MSNNSLNVVTNGPFHPDLFVESRLLLVFVGVKENILYTELNSEHSTHTHTHTQQQNKPKHKTLKVFIHDDLEDIVNNN